MNVSTESIPSATSTGAPYVAGNFAPLRSEVTSFDLEVIGHVPEELTGRFLRIGPNPIDELDRVRLVRHQVTFQPELSHTDFPWGEPIATIRLPVRVPFGFHGGWAPDRITVVE